MIMKTIEFLWCYWNMCWLLTRLRPGGKPHEGSWCRETLARGWRKWTLNFGLWTLDIGHWIRERSDRGSATRTRANTGQCLRTLRARRPEPSEATCTGVFVLHNMQTPLDFNSVDFLGMLEVLSLQLIFMHSYVWRNFLWWIHYYAIDIIPLCLADTVTVGHWLYDALIVCLLFCWLRPMYSSRHTKVNAIPLLGMRYGLSSRIEGGFSISVGDVDVLR